jgi:hypothetical protein
MSKTSIFLICIFIIVLAALLAVNTLYSPQPVLKSIPAMFPTKTPVDSENTLMITPTTLTIPSGKPTSLQVTIDSKGELPSVIQMELAYDPGVLASVKIAPGTFFTTPQVLLNNINANNGRISYAIAPGADQTTPTASNLLATITVIPRVTAYTQVTTLSFLPKTIVKTKTSPNTLKIAYGTKITVKNRLAPAYAPWASASGRIINY